MIDNVASLVLEFHSVVHCKHDVASLVFNQRTKTIGLKKKTKIVSWNMF